MPETGARKFIVSYYITLAWCYVENLKTSRE